MRRVITAATVAIAIVGIAGRSHTSSTPASAQVRSPTSVLEPTTHAPSTTLPSITTVRSVSTVSAAPHTTSTAATTTTTGKPARQPRDRLQTLRACLGLAATNNLRAIIANRAWYQRQLAGLTAHKRRSRARYDAVVLEQSNAQMVIKAQYTIDVANCYINDAH